MNEEPVYVDDYFAAYGRMKMCHMASNNIEALHAMADKIGVARKWFQNKGRWPHYDVCKAKRELAISFGAIPVTAREIVKIIKRKP